MQYFREVRAGLIKDLGGEVNVSTAQMILVDRIIFKLGFLRLVEVWLTERGSPFAADGQKFEPIVEAYLSYTNSLRNDLNLLGIERKEIPETIDLKSYLAEKYSQKSVEKRDERPAEPRPQDDKASESSQKQGGPGGGPGQAGPFQNGEGEKNE